MIRQLSRNAPTVTVLLGMVAAFASVPGLAATLRQSPVRVVRYTTPDEIRFKEDARGLMTRVWVNDAGPFEFAIDTGAGMTVISQRVAAEAGLSVGRTVSVTGLSGRVSEAQESAPAQLAAGSPTNRFPLKAPVTISNGLPAGVDGLLDPAIAFWPLGFTMDVSGGSLKAFDPSTSPISRHRIPDGGAVTQWRMRGNSRRPYVTLDGSRSALIDTGSRFGLAIGRGHARSFGIDPDVPKGGPTFRDIGGGAVTARRTSVPRVLLGEMLLENVPTDVLSGTASGTPILIGRDVLRPFVISFDPRARLIRIALR